MSSPVVDCSVITFMILLPYEIAYWVSLQSLHSHEHGMTT